MVYNTFKFDLNNELVKVSDEIKYDFTKLK